MSWYRCVVCHHKQVAQYELQDKVLHNWKFMRFVKINFQKVLHWNFQLSSVSVQFKCRWHPNVTQLHRQPNIDLRYFHLCYCTTTQESLIAVFSTSERSTIRIQHDHKPLSLPLSKISISIEFAWKVSLSMWKHENAKRSFHSRSFQITNKPETKAAL